MLDEKETSDDEKLEESFTQARFPIRLNLPDGKIEVLADAKEVRAIEVGFELRLPRFLPVYSVTRRYGQQKDFSSHRSRLKPKTSPLSWLPMTYIRGPLLPSTVSRDRKPTL